MIRRTLTTSVLAIALTLAAGASTASASVTCTTNAAAEIGGAAVNGPRAGWDPPVWTYDMPDLNMSVDVQAYTQPDAASRAQTWLQGQVDAACSSERAPVGSPTLEPAPAPEYTRAATDMLAKATIIYLGASWGPIPLWEAALPALNATIDIAATSESEARGALVNVVARMLAGTAAPVTTPDAPVVTATHGPVTADTIAVPSSDPVQAASDAAVLFPDRSEGFLVRAGYGYAGANG